MVIELLVVQFWSEIILVISNRTRAARSFDFEITRMISDLIIYKQQFLQSDWLRTCQLIPNQRPVQFHQCKKMKLSAKR